VVNARKPPTVIPAATPPAPLLIGTEQDAAEAFGDGSGLHLWAREFLRHTQGGPVILRPADDAAVTAAVRIADLRWPAPGPALHAVILSYEPQRSPVLQCSIDGAQVPLEQGADGWWRPRRTEGDG
jgi:hypothetical protein